MSPTKLGARDLPGVLATAGRLLARHWPALLALAFLGTAVRAGAIWLAVVVSDKSAFIAQLIMILAPLGYLVPIIVMLRLCRSSLPSIAALEAADGPVAVTERRERRLVDVTVSMLVPFLAVYVASSLLSDDLVRFLNQAAYEEYSQDSGGSPVEYDFIGRLGVYQETTLIAIIAVAWILRWALGRFERRTSFLALAFVGALVEVYYTTQVAKTVEEAKAGAGRWVENRSSVNWVVDRYDSMVDRLGWLANPVDRVTDWLFGLFGSLDAVVVVPLAWLTLGAVVLGHKLAAPKPVTHPVLDRLTAIPERIRQPLGSLAADIKERFSAFFNGLRLLAEAGLFPMLAFSLVFLLVLQLAQVFAWMLRFIIGPIETTTWLAFSPMENGLGLALSMALTAPLLAAALDWLVAARLTLPEVSASEQAPGADPEVVSQSSQEPQEPGKNRDRS